MIDHAGINVADWSRARRLYDRPWSAWSETAHDGAGREHRG